MLPARLFAFLLGLGLLGLDLLGATAARAGEPVMMERRANGIFFHQAVCGHNPGPGVARCFARVRTDSQGRVMPGRPGPAASSGQVGYGPADLRAAYNITATGSSSTIVAVVDAYGYANAESDLAVYRRQYGLPACTHLNGCFTMIDQSGGTRYPRYNSGWAQEQALDLDMVSAMCPNCRILLVQASSATNAALATAVNTAVAKGATVVSNSYGGDEGGSQSYASAYSHNGVAITASSGDSGYGASFPATAPGVIAVGGTTLSRASNSRGWSETVWNGAGSGCSALFNKPVWQTDTLCAKRMESDISAVADPSTGVAVYGPVGRNTTSGWMVFGGTSVSAPLIGGIYGAIAAHPNAASKIWTSRAALNDVTSGNNGSCGGTYFCVAGTGYDGPTGNGTPAGTGAF